MSNQLLNDRKLFAEEGRRKPTTTRLTLTLRLTERKAGRFVGSAQPLLSTITPQTKLLAEVHECHSMNKPQSTAHANVTDLAQNNERFGKKM